MNKFKVGDKVERINSNFNSDLQIGDIVTIEHFREADGTEGFYSKEKPRYWLQLDQFKLVKEDEMNKMPELETGNRVELRDGCICLVVKDQGKFYGDLGFFNIEDIDPITGKLIAYNGMPQYDIMRVYEGDNFSEFLNLRIKGKILWEYKEPVVPTEADKLREEMAVLKARLRELGEE